LHILVEQEIDGDFNLENVLYLLFIMGLGESVNHLTMWSRISDVGFSNKAVLSFAVSFSAMVIGTFKSIKENRI
jgi:hypothetical protein